VTAASAIRISFSKLPDAYKPGVTVEIGGVPVLFETDDPEFCAMIESRYSGFVNSSAPPAYRFKVQLISSRKPSDKDVLVSRNGPLWTIERGDFRAECDLQKRTGTVLQSRNPYSIDTVLRILHSLVLAEQGGFLLHAASAIAGGRSFLFAGVSGAGKTTLSRFAPPSVTVLTDEISYVRRDGQGYRAYGTPFAGELARVGENVSAPLAALYLLAKGPVNRIEQVEPMVAARALMRHTLFFAQDHELVKKVFDSVITFVSRVNPARLTFAPDERVWDLIG
jgi:hypothetical protein